MSIQWSPGYTMDMVEEEVIRKALRHFRGNKTQTASALGISIRTIDNKLEKYGIENPKTELEIQQGLEHPVIEKEEVVELPVPSSVADTKMKAKKK